MREFSIIKKRILQYLDSKGISRYKFYQETGVTNGVLSQSGGISEDTLLRFLSVYGNDVSSNWLITGEGEMLKSPEAAEPGNLVIDCKYLIDKIEKQAEEIGRLKAENEHLKRALAPKGTSAGCATAV